MNFAICFDKNFQKWAVVCLYSIWEQHKSDTGKIRLVILSDVPYNKCIWQLKKVLKHFDFTYDNPGDDLDCMPTSHQFSKAVYWRLILPQILVKYEIEKAIYLDSDTIVVKGLDDLYNTNLEGYFCGGVLDIHSETHINRLELTQGYAVNSGVLLMDVPKMNSIDWVGESIRLNSLGKASFFDQDLVNIILDKKMKLLDLKWNKQTGHFLHKYPEKPAIVHFTMWADKKPWFTTFRHPFIPKLLEILLRNGFLVLFIMIYWNYFKNIVNKKTSSFSKKYFGVYV
jgi:lipopolysaccharide biosynthesis glycosyltransferase